MAKKKAPTSDKILLPEVRLSFPRLWKPKAFQPGQDPRYEATFLLDKSNATHAAKIRELKATAKQMIEGAGLDESDFKFCFTSGDKKKYDGYAGCIAVATHNSIRPPVVNRRREPVEENEAGAPYAGCYVNAKITLWLQDNQYGKRINANLLTVQFVRDGERFGMQAVDPEDEFEMLGDEPAGKPGKAPDDDFDLD